MSCILKWLDQTLVCMIDCEDHYLFLLWPMIRQCPISKASPSCLNPSLGHCGTTLLPWIVYKLPKLMFLLCAWLNDWMTLPCAVTYVQTQLKKVTHITAKHVYCTDIPIHWCIHLNQGDNLGKAFYIRWIFTITALRVSVKIIKRRCLKEALKYKYHNVIHYRHLLDSILYISYF